MSSLCKYVNFKSVLGTGLIFSVVFVNINLYVLNKDLPPIEDRCSADNPEFSIFLDLWMTLPDGSLQVSDGTVYPPGASWESGGVVRGCPCTARTCPTTFCSIENEKLTFLSMVKTIDEPIDERIQAQIVTPITPIREWIWQNLNEYEYMHRTISNGTAKYTELYKVVQHPNGTKSYKFERVLTKREVTLENELHLMEIDFNEVNDIAFLLNQFLSHIVSKRKNNNTIEYLSVVPQCDYYGEDNTYDIIDILNYSDMEISNICFLTRGNAFLNAFACTRSKWFWVRTVVTDELVKRSWRIRFVILALLLHIVTIIALAIIPYLHPVNRLCLICYLLAQLSRKTAMVIRHFVNTNDLLTSLLFSVTYFGSLSSKLWQLSLAYSIWKAFSCEKSPYSKKSFIISSVFSWMVSLIYTLFVVIWVDNECVDEISHIGASIAFVPGLLVEVCCMVMCCYTVWRLRVWRRGAKRLDTSESRRHNAPEVRWSILVVKVILLDVGLEYIIFTVLTIARMRYFWSQQPFPLPLIWYKIPDDLNNLRGVQLFFFFVLKKDFGAYVTKRWGVVEKLTSFTSLISKRSPQVSCEKSDVVRNALNSESIVLLAPRAKDVCV